MPIYISPFPAFLLTSSTLEIDTPQQTTHCKYHERLNNETKLFHLNHNNMLIVTNANCLESASDGMGTHPAV